MLYHVNIAMLNYTYAHGSPNVHTYNTLSINGHFVEIK